MSDALAQLMERNLQEVWGQRSEDKRLAILEDIYATDANMYHVNDETSGIAAINAAITSTLSNIPREFAFAQLSPIIINNNLGRLTWALGPRGAAPVATGMDIAIFENGKIKSLYVFLNS